jgi:hypothetical protein
MPAHVEPVVERPVLAERTHPTIRAVTNVATICMLILCVPIYGQGFIGAIGTFAIAAQTMFFSGGAAHLAGFGLQSEQNVARMRRQAMAEAAKAVLVRKGWPPVL